jgi:hypothetical protein
MPGELRYAAELARVRRAGAGCPPPGRPAERSSPPRSRARQVEDRQLEVDDHELQPGAECDDGVEADQDQPHLGRADQPVADRESTEGVALEVDADRGSGRRPRSASRSRGASAARARSRSRRLRSRRRDDRGSSRRWAARSGAPSERAVERVAQPLQHQQPARRPQPGGAVVGELIGAADAECSEHAERGQVVAQHPPRQPRGDPAQHALLRPREQEARLAHGLDRPLE